MDEKVQQDFPIDWPDDHYVTRREFLKFLTMASGGLAVGSAALAVWSRYPRETTAYDPYRIATAADLPVGKAVPFNYPTERDPCILIRLSETEYVAYSRRCTHLSCPVQYQSDTNRFYCPCHNGAFAVSDGSVLFGPPPAPLPRVELEDREGDLYAVGITRVKAEFR